MKKKLDSNKPCVYKVSEKILHLNHKTFIEEVNKIINYEINK